MKVICNCEECAFNEESECTLETISIIDNFDEGGFAICQNFVYKYISCRYTNEAKLQIYGTHKYKLVDYNWEDQNGLYEYIGDAEDN